MYNTDIAQGDGPTNVTLTPGVGSPLVQMLLASEIQPGSPVSYELCKTIYSYHPLGAVLTDAPIKRAQSKPREISIPELGEKQLIAQFQKTARDLSRLGQTMIIFNLLKTSRMYGVASLAVGEVGVDPAKPLDISKIANSDIFVSVLDPLNTAGSLVLDQNPNSPGFLKPMGSVVVDGQAWHPSRLFTKMNEDPVYIEWSSSAFGFVGRSVYQRALYPLKTFVQSMITDQMVTQKAGLLIAKMEMPGSILDKLTMAFYGKKRAALKSGVTGQTLGIGVTESIETLNMQNIDQAQTVARMNVLKNIASAAGMPASIIAQETMVEGFGEGSEDMNKEIEFLEYIRTEMQPVYDFLDRIIMRKAWTPEFYEILKREYPKYRDVSYESALYLWMQAFQATWPNLKVETEEEKSKRDDVKFKAVIASVESIAPLCDPKNKAAVIEWAADNLNACEDIFASKIDIDTDALQTYLEENRDAMQQQSEEQADKPEGRPRPFSAAS